MENCRLGSGVTVATGTVPDPASISLRMHNCDSGATNTRFFTQNYVGTTQQETTVVRNGGASDGTTPVSWNLSANANAYFGMPLASEPIAIWNGATGASLTATIEIAGTGALNTNDIWVEFEYPGSASFPQGSVATTKARLAVRWFRHTCEFGVLERLAAKHAAIVRDDPSANGRTRHGQGLSGQARHDCLRRSLHHADEWHRQQPPISPAGIWRRQRNIPEWRRN